LKPKTRKTLNLTTEKAAHALSILILDGKITAKDVTNAFRRRELQIQELRAKLATLESGAVAEDGPFPMVADVGRRTRRKMKRRMSAARRAALKLHGKYLGHIRTLPKAAKTKIKAIRAKAGVHAAIKAARKAAMPPATGANPRRRGVQGTQHDYQGSKQRKLARYQQRERPKPDKHGGSGAGRQQGGSGAGRERG
jgi:hypothetical protein